MTKPNKPRIRFCWGCDKQLRGNFHVHVVVDGLERIVHKQCAGALVRAKCTCKESSK